MRAPDGLLPCFAEDREQARCDGTIFTETTARDEGARYLLICAASSMQTGLAFPGLVVGAMTMGMHELSAAIESAARAGHTDGRMRPERCSAPPGPHPT